MNDQFPTMRSRSVSSIAVILTLVALCFSVGEGLRLRPFRASEIAKTDASDRSSVDPASGLLVFKSGPLDVPARGQKRSKRFAIDLSGTVSRYSYKPFTGLFQSLGHQTITSTSIELVALPSGRAPPLTS